MMKLLILEDEPLAAEKLSSYILRWMPEADIYGPLDKISKVQAFLSEPRGIELIFSDIELLDGPVFNALKELDLPCPIIYTTAYDSYWMQAFQNMGIEYLLKPFPYKRFISAMASFEQLRKSLSVDNSRQVNVTPNQKYKRRLLIRKRKCIELLQVEDVICFRASGGIILAYDIADKCHYLSQNSVSALENTLDPKYFFRINRSDIVNLHFIQRFEKYTKNTLAIFLQGVDSPCITSKTKSAKFRQWLDS